MATPVRRGPLPLHPMTLPDILDGAFKLLRANARTVLTITAVFVVPIQVLSAFLQRDIFGGRSIGDFISDPSVGSDGRASTGTGTDPVATVVAFAVTVLVLPFVAGAVSRVVAASYLGDEVSVGEALRAAGHRWWSLVSSWVLVHLFEGLVWIAAVAVAIALAVGGALGWAPILLLVLLGLAGIPWAVVAMAWCVAVAPAIVVEDLGPVAGMRRSIRLLRPRTWSTVAVALVGGFLASVLGQVLGVIPQSIGLAIGGDRGGWVLLAVGGVLTSLVTTPLVAIISTLVYFDGRIRREGFDLEVMAAEMARTAPSASAS
jgi:MFS family permease